MQGTSIYVCVYDDRVEVESPGGFAPGVTMENFGNSSIRRNHIIADMFHRMRKVERMGSGIKKMRRLMKEAGLKDPVFEIENFFRVTFYRDPRYSLKAAKESVAKVAGQLPRRHPTSTPQVPHKYATSTPQVSNKRKILEECRKPKKIKAMIKAIGLKDRVYFMRSYLHPLLEEQLLAMTDPDSPRSPKQRYVTTQKGFEWLKGQ